MSTEVNKITLKGGTLVIPDHTIVPFIEGDGIGRDITPAAQAVINAAVEKSYGKKRSLIWKEVYAGEKALKVAGSWLPVETVSAFRN